MLVVTDTMYMSSLTHTYTFSIIISFKSLSAYIDERPSIHRTPTVLISLSDTYYDHHRLFLLNSLV